MAVRRKRQRVVRSEQAPDRGAAAGQGEERKSVIVTFKPKHQRRDKTDKLQIVKDSIKSRVTFFDAATFSAETAGVPTGLPAFEVGFDVNLYEAPIVTASLTAEEIAALRGNPNVEAVEDDGPVYALPVENLVFEGQPAPQAETVPIGVQQVKAPMAWGCSRGKGIKVAVLDTGIDWTHPDLTPNPIRDHPPTGSSPLHSV